MCAYKIRRTIAKEENLEQGVIKGTTECAMIPIELKSYFMTTRKAFKIFPTAFWNFLIACRKD